MLDAEGKPLSKSALVRQIGGNQTRIFGSIEVWVERGFLVKLVEGQSHRIALPGYSTGE